MVQDTSASLKFHMHSIYSHIVWSQCLKDSNSFCRWFGVQKNMFEQYSCHHQWRQSIIIFYIPIISVISSGGTICLVYCFCQHTTHAVMSAVQCFRGSKVSTENNFVSTTSSVWQDFEKDPYRDKSFFKRLSDHALHSHKAPLTKTCILLPHRT